MAFRYLICLLVPLLLAPGCSTGGHRSDPALQGIVALLGEPDLDLHRATLPPPPPSPQPAPGGAPSAPVQPPTPAPTPSPELPPPQPVTPVAFAQKGGPGAHPSPLRIPTELPGADAPPLQIPRSGKEREEVLKRTFPAIPPLPPEPPLAGGPEGRPLSLADLQRLGETYSPAIKNAVAACEAARAAAWQSGMYPNPTVGFEHDTVETGPAGYPGFFVEQVIKTGGKLTLQQAAAMMDVLSAKLALRRARADLRTQIRGFYFAVLVARESVRVNDALFRFTEEAYRLQVQILTRGGFAAPYEPLQIQPTVLQAQLSLLQARNQQRASWRQLAAAIGLPDMPPSQLQGRVDMPVPAFQYEDVLARLKYHTDVLTAHVSIHKAKYQLQLARVVPLPDVDLRVMVQKDYTTPPNQISHSFMMSIPVPAWDQNKGGIRQAEWLLAQASVGPDQARNALAATLADAFARYETARRQVEVAYQQVTAQTRVYRAVYARRQQEANAVSFGDLFVVQQSLAGYVTGYVTALGLQWQAVVDLANLLQAEDVFQACPCQHAVLPVPDLNHLEPPPGPVPGPPSSAQHAPGPGAVVPTPAPCDPREG